MGLTARQNWSSFSTSLYHPESLIFYWSCFIATLCNLSSSVPTSSKQSASIMQQNGLWRQVRQTATWIKLWIASKSLTAAAFPIFAFFSLYSLLSDGTQMECVWYMAADKGKRKKKKQSCKSNMFLFHSLESAQLCFKRRDISLEKRDNSSHKMKWKLGLQLKLRPTYDLCSQQ